MILFLGYVTANIIKKKTNDEDKASRNGMSLQRLHPGSEINVYTPSLFGKNGSYWWIEPRIHNTIFLAWGVTMEMKHLKKFLQS